MLRTSLALSLLALTGCGFTPLYAPKSKATDQLAMVHIKTIADRNGQILRNRLRQLMNSHGDSQAERYDLTVTLEEIREDTAVRQDSTPKRTQLTYVARIKLWDREQKKIRYEDSFEASTGFTTASQASYGAIPAFYADQKAQERAMELLVQEITTALSSELIESH